MFLRLLYTWLLILGYSAGFRVTHNTHRTNFLTSTMENKPSCLLNQMVDKKVVIIVGPTASGKTKFSIDLCRNLMGLGVNPEIINADSMQVYKGFAVGTAKPSEEEVNSVPHHLLNYIEPTVDYNASMFVRDCSTVVEKLFSENKLPVLVGGTNLYIEGLLWPSVIDFEQTDDYESLEDEFKDHDTEDLYDMLREVDPVRAGELHKNDRKRIIRSLDVYHVHGITHTELMKLRRRERDEVGTRYNALLFVLKSDPEIHRKRIRERVDFMLKKGILSECSELMSLKEQNPDIDVRKGIFQSIAYKELIPLLEEPGGSIRQPTPDLLDKCFSVLETRTWRYAQRQKTWINNRLLKNDLKSHIVNTDGRLPFSQFSDLNSWDAIVEECSNVAMNHLSEKD